MSFTEDRSVFFNTGDFADAGLYAGADTVNGILNEEYVELYQGSGVGVSTTRPVFWFNADDITPTIGATLVVNSISYIVRDIQSERGIGKLYLEAV